MEKREAEKARREAVRKRKNPTEPVSAHKWRGIARAVKEGVYVYIGLLESFMVTLTTLPTPDKLQAARAHDCLIYQLAGTAGRYHFPEEGFEEKWRIIGKEQRLHILRILDNTGL
jgi:hypothetical protein